MTILALSGAHTPRATAMSIEELEGEVEAAHLGIFLQVPDQLILQGVRIVLLQGAYGIVGARRGRIFYDICQR
jgi:hypothetical protein